MNTYNINKIIQYDGFICYSRNDNQIAETLHNNLKIYGKNIFRDINNIKEFAPVKEEIENAIVNSNILIFILSSSSAISEYCERELKFATLHGKPIYTILITHINAIKEQINKTVYDILVDNRNWVSIKNFSLNEIAIMIINDQNYNHKDRSIQSYLLMRMINWKQNGNKKDYLLKEEEYQDAISWQDRATKNNIECSFDLKSYFEESRIKILKDKNKYKQLADERNKSLDEAKKQILNSNINSSSRALLLGDNFGAFNDALNAYQINQEDISVKLLLGASSYTIDAIYNKINILNQELNHIINIPNKKVFVITSISGNIYIAKWKKNKYIIKLIKETNEIIYDIDISASGNKIAIITKSGKLWYGLLNDDIKLYHSFKNVTFPKLKFNNEEEFLLVILDKSYENINDNWIYFDCNTLQIKESLKLNGKITFVNLHFNDIIYSNKNGEIILSNITASKQKTIYQPPENIENFKLEYVNSKKDIILASFSKYNLVLLKLHENKIIDTIHVFRGKLTPQIVTISPDGHYLALTWFDRSITIFDLQNQNTIAELIPPNNANILNVFFNNDNTEIFVISSSSIFIWKIENALLVQTYSSPFGNFSGVILINTQNNINTNFITIDDIGYIIIWKDTEKLVQVPKKVFKSCHYAKYSPNKSKIAFSSDSKYFIWDLNKNKISYINDEFENNPNSTLNFSNQGKFLALPTKDGNITIYNLNINSKEGITIRGHKNSIRSCSFFPDEKDEKLITCGGDGKVYITQNWSSNIKYETLYSFREEVLFSEFSPIGNFIFAGCVDGNLLIYNIKNKNKKIITFDSEPTSFSFSYDEEYLVVGEDGGKLHIFSGKNFQIHKTIFLNGYEWVGIDMSLSGREVIVFGMTDKIYIIDLVKATKTFFNGYIGGSIWKAKFAFNDTMIIFADVQEKRISICDRSRKYNILQLEIPTKMITGFDIDIDNSEMVITTANVVFNPSRSQIGKTSSNSENGIFRWKLNKEWRSPKYLSNILEKNF